MKQALVALVSIVALLDGPAGALATDAPAASATAAPAEGLPRACDSYGEPVKTGTVPKELDEMSGIAASRRHPGIYYSHNDSGNDLVIHALRKDGKVVTRFPLRGVKARDIEDIAVGPCASGKPETCIYLGDTGDNRARNADARIIRFPEPAKLNGHPLQASLSRFRYPDGPRNVEALLIEQGTGRLFVVAKSMGSLGKVFRLDGLDKPDGGQAVQVGEIASPRPLVGITTGGDVHPNGERVILRTYADAWELRAPGAKRLEDVLAASPVKVPAPRQQQAEAIAYATSGDSYLLGTEGEGQAIYEVSCAGRAPELRDPGRAP